MWQILRFEVKISTSVGRFPIDFGGQYRLFPNDQSIKKGNRTA
jgi:hypothetical protein